MSIQAVLDLAQKEYSRQKNGITLIASENYVNDTVRELTGSVLTNKYIEGYPGRRYYGGCEFVDQIETIAIEECKKLFGAQHANVQPHAGSQANMAVFFALLNPGDTILSMKLSAGGHLTHGHNVNFSGKLYNIVSYTLDEKTLCLDYDQIEKLALEHKPKLIIAGASAYPRTIDFARFRKIADLVGAYLLADMAHIAGLVAAGLHPSPVPHAHVVTSTTHKTLRGPRGALILSTKELGEKIDKWVMPGMQGGAFGHVIAAKAVSFIEAQTQEFKNYQAQVIKNAQTMAQWFVDHGYKVTTGGTDTHLFLVDLSGSEWNGHQAEIALEQAGIYVNRNTIPFDVKGPLHPSGIRIGTPAITTRGATEKECVQVAQLIHEILQNKDNQQVHDQVAQQVKDLASRLRFE